MEELFTRLWNDLTGRVGGPMSKFFQYLREQEGLEPDHRALGPRRFATLMISIGLASLLLATIQ